MQRPNSTRFKYVSFEGNLFEHKILIFQYEHARLYGYVQCHSFNDINVQLC